MRKSFKPFNLFQFHSEQGRLETEGMPFQGGFGKHASLLEATLTPSAHFQGGLETELVIETAAGSSFQSILFRSVLLSFGN